VPVAKQRGVACRAFEPDPVNVRLLAKNIDENGVSRLVRTYQTALTGADREMDLERSLNNPGDHRLRLGGTRPGLFNEQERETIRVPVRRLDGLLDARSPPARS
jgi:FkbM family methyltransferase